MNIPRRSTIFIPGAAADLIKHFVWITNSFIHGSLAVSWKYDTSNFKPVTKIERQACANKAHKHRGRGGPHMGNSKASLYISHVPTVYYTHTNTHTNRDHYTQSHTKEQIRKTNT